MIKIMTDSTCDIAPERQAELGIEIVPLSVHFGDESFLDGIDLTNKDFYDRLRSADQSPTTAQVNPDEFATRFEKHKANGDEVVGIFLSSALSGTFQSAVIAKDIAEYDDVHLVDSATVTFSLGLLVLEAVKLRDAGLSAVEMTAKLNELAPRIRLFAVVDTLKYLKMGGRISATSAAVGSLLGVTPILSVRDGKIEAAGKVRGKKNALPWIEERIAEMPVDTSLPIGFAHSDAPEIMEQFKEYFVPKLSPSSVCESNIGCVVGTHTGPGCAGIAYFEKV